MLRRANSLHDASAQQQNGVSTTIDGYLYRIVVIFNLQSYEKYLITHAHFHPLSLCYLQLSKEDG